MAGGFGGGGAGSINHSGGGGGYVGGTSANYTYGNGGGSYCADESGTASNGATAMAQCILKLIKKLNK